MLESIFIATDGRSAKTKSTNVAKKISNASTDINNAKKELNNVDYVDLSYEIDQLESMYKKNNNQASEFETFASTLESMVNDYISVDKECATRIKSNGKNHRKNTGLAKNLALATICASFDKVGDKLEQGIDILSKWVEEVIEFINEKDLDSYLQILEGGAQLWASIGAFAAAISAAIILAPTVAAASGFIATTLAIGTIALPLITSAFSMYVGMDKLASGLLDVTNVYETNGSTITKEACDNDLFSFLYDVADIFSVSGVSSIVGKLADADNVVGVMNLFGKGEFADNALKFITNSKKGLDANQYISYVQDTNTLVQSICSSDGIEEFLLKKQINTKNINSFLDAFIESLLKTDIVGVLG